MKLDKEQKRVLKAAWPAFLAFPFASPFFYWLFGKLDSWTDALLLFAGYVDGATTVAENCGGGGRSSSNDWGRKPDEDDLRWARRCIQRAQELHKKRYSYRRRR